MEKEAHATEVIMANGESCRLDVEPDDFINRIRDVSTGEPKPGFVRVGDLVLRIDHISLIKAVEAEIYMS